MNPESDQLFAFRNCVTFVKLSGVYWASAMGFGEISIAVSLVL